MVGAEKFVETYHIKTIQTHWLAQLADKRLRLTRQALQSLKKEMGNAGHRWNKNWTFVYRN